jgi:hypothetical protein
MKVVSESWICGAAAPSSVAMLGNAGRYMSIDMGPRVQRAPRRPTSFSLVGPASVGVIFSPAEVCGGVACGNATAAGF